MLDESTPESTTCDNKINHAENQALEEKVVALRPIWQIIIGILLFLICLTCLYNLKSSCHRIKHPNVRASKTKEINDSK